MTADDRPHLSDEDLERVLRAADLRPRERGPDCPDELHIAAYLDGRVSPAEREAVEVHLADCAHCLALVGLLGREDGPNEAPTVPETTLARARKLARPTRTAPVRHAPRWAAAAVALVAVPLLLHLSRPTDESSELGRESAPRVTRNLPPAPNDLQVLRPAAGSVVDPRDVSIRWSPVAGSAYYDVRIVTEAGAPVVEQRVTGTEWRPDSSLRLEPGSEYYVRVDAYPADGKSVGSVHVPFKVRE